MIAFPNAKINLGLNIIKKRTDGYHNLESCFFPIEWCDILEIILADDLKFSSSGIDIPGDSNHNLCFKAFQILSADFDIPPVRIHLHKIIPIGAGLGGGSSDGAFALMMLNEMFKLGLSISELEKYATQLGSDCPFFINNTPQYVTGTGETFNKININLSGKQLVVVKPDIHISTAEAYAGLKPKYPSINCKDIIEGNSIKYWKGLLLNDFENSIFPNHPEIATLKKELYDQGALYASMTGSGAAVFGIFEKDCEVRVKTTHIWKQALA